MNPNDVLYALSTLAQTCAALAAFVGAVGLFRLQSLKNAQQDAERKLRVVVGSTVMRTELADRRPIREITTRARSVIASPGDAAKYVEEIQETLDKWESFAPRLQGAVERYLYLRRGILG